MKHTSFKSVFIRTLSVLMLLNVSIIPSHAQYYMNVFTKNGQKTRFAVTDVDSVTYTAIPVPTELGYVSKMTMSYIENYPTNTSVFSEGTSIVLGYDNQNRVTSVSTPDGFIKLDYSKKDSIIVISNERERLDTLVYHLDNEGLVRTAEDDTKLITMEYDGVYASKMAHQPKTKEPGHYYIYAYDFIYEEGALSTIVVDNQSTDLSYKYNYASPEINLNYNWFLLTGGAAQYTPMWLGYCGNLGDKLLEYPSFYYKKSSFVDLVPPTTSEPAGTYHYEKTYYQLVTDTVKSISLDKNDKGYPISISFSMEVEEYVHSYDYVVVVDTIGFKGGDHGTKGGTDSGEIQTESRRYIVEGSEKDEPTGNIVGTNDVVYSFEYKE